jgi:uncharacterized protein (TIGR02001 family)
MKTLTKFISAAAIAAGSLGVSSVASADVSYNIGYVSEYYYRGIYQKNSSASAGIDYEEGGFYAGAWTADVGDGLEYDLYAGYGMDIGDLSVGVGFTGYYYTDDWDETYEEVNLSVGYGPVSIGYSSVNGTAMAVQIMISSTSLLIWALASTVPMAPLVMNSMATTSS